MKTEDLPLEGGELVGKAIGTPLPPSSAGPRRFKSAYSNRSRNGYHHCADPINEFLMRVSITQTASGE